MSLTISVSPEAEARLRLRAQAAGEDLSSYVAKLLTLFADVPTPLEELSGPIYRNFLASGMTEDELGEELERAKHEMREARRLGKLP